MALVNMSARSRSIQSALEVLINFLDNLCSIETLASRLVLLSSQKSSGGRHRHHVLLERAFSSRAFAFAFASRVLCGCDELLLTVTAWLSFDCFFDAKHDADKEAGVFAEQELKGVSAPALNVLNALNDALFTLNEVSVLNEGLDSIDSMIIGNDRRATFDAFPGEALRLSRVRLKRISIALHVVKKGGNPTSARQSLESFWGARTLILAARTVSSRQSSALGSSIAKVRSV
jgi:hypothetical protein